jgi:hypothetical protein
VTSELSWWAVRRLEHQRHSSEKEESMAQADGCGHGYAVAYEGQLRVHRWHQPSELEWKIL